MSNNNYNLTDKERNSIFNSLNAMKEYLNYGNVYNEERYCDMVNAVYAYKDVMPKFIFRKFDRFIDIYLSPFLNHYDKSFDIYYIEEEAPTVVKEMLHLCFDIDEYGKFFPREGCLINIVFVNYKLDEFAKKEIYPVLYEES